MEGNQAKSTPCVLNSADCQKGSIPGSSERILPAHLSYLDCGSLGLRAMGMVFFEECLFLCLWDCFFRMESQAGILQAQMSDLVLMLGTGAQSGGKKKILLHKQIHF